MALLTFTQEHDDTLAKKWVNLAEERFGSKVLFATDDFFAEKENLIKPGRGIFIPDKYTEHGKWMDGWESRRKRVEGHDYADIRLGLRGIIKGFDIDTNHFTGNHPPRASIQACCLDHGDPLESTQWTEILPTVELGPGVQHLHEINNENEWTHIRLNIYPDGGVARLRVFGEVKKDWEQVKADEIIDLLAVANEGRALACSDMYFSRMENLIAPGRGRDMGDGWETKRRRGPGHDWCILKLGRAGKLIKFEVDTAHFKGNYPDTCSIDALYCEDDTNLENLEWKEILPQTKLQADHIHLFESSVIEMEKVSHLRLNMFPDGGISRLRAYGKIL